MKRIFAPFIDLIQNILADEPSGRLYKALVETGKAASIFGYAFGYMEPGIVLNMAQVQKQDPVRPVMDKMNEVIEGLSSNPITDDEIKRAKNSLLKDIDLALKDSGRIGVEMSEWAASGDWRLFFLHRCLEKSSISTGRLCRIRDTVLPLGTARTSARSMYLPMAMGSSAAYRLRSEAARAPKKHPCPWNSPPELSGRNSGASPMAAWFSARTPSQGREATA